MLRILSSGYSFFFIRAGLKDLQKWRFSAIIFAVDNLRTKYFKNTLTVNITYSSFFIALGLLLPQVFHGAGLGKVISPMHIPVLICAFFLDWPFALAVGVLTPSLSALLFPMPDFFPLMFLIMFFELGTYAVTANLVYTKALRPFKDKIKHNIINVYISLISAIIAGRVIGALVATAAFWLFGLGENTGFFIYLLGLFTGGAVAIAIQLLLIPPVTEILKKRLISREPKEDDDNVKQQTEN